MEKEYTLKYWPKGINDRYDGWRVKKVDPVFAVIPYFLRTRMDAQNFFEECLPIDHIEEFIKEHKEDIPDLSIMHVIMAALTRLISQRPRLNRFVMWNKIYARNHINISIAVKRSLTADGEETLIKPYFMPDATLQDVVRITHKDTVQDLVNKGKDLEKIVLSRAVQKHIERKVLAYKNKTVIFN